MLSDKQNITFQIILRSLMSYKTQVIINTNLKKYLYFIDFFGFKHLYPVTNKCLRQLCIISNFVDGRVQSIDEHRIRSFMSMNYIYYIFKDWSQINHKITEHFLRLHCNCSFRVTSFNLVLPDRRYHVKRLMVFLMSYFALSYFMMISNDIFYVS